MSDSTVAEAATDLAEREARLAELAHHPEMLPLLPGQARPHPTPRQYVVVAALLVVITAAEVALSYAEGDVNSDLLIAGLLVMAAVKFFLVAAWYMHLRTDKAIFRRVFLVGLVGAFAVYLVALLTFGIFSR